MFAVREDGKLVEIFGEPWRGFRDVDKSILNQASLRVHAHCLLTGRLAARDAMAAIRDQVLDQLCSRGLVLDQHDSRTKYRCCSRTARLSSGYSRRLRNSPMRKTCLS